MKKLIFFVLVAALSLVLAAPAFSATLCVDPANPSCYATIQGAIDAAAPGDIIQIMPGTYFEAVVIPSDKPGITLEGREIKTSRVKGIGTLNTPAGPGKVIIDALDECPNGQTEGIGTQHEGIAGIFIQPGADDANIRYLTVRHSCEYNIWSMANNTIIESCRIIGGWGGVRIDNYGICTTAPDADPAAIVQNCEVAGNGPGGGIVIMSDNALAYNNQILNNYNLGVHIDGYNAQVITNQIHSVGASVYDLCPEDEPMEPYFHGVCVAVTNAEGATVRNNNISNCALIGIKAMAYDFLIEDNSIDSALLGILHCGAYGLVNNNIINGVLAGMVSFAYGGLSLEQAEATSDDFVTSLLGGTLAQDLPTYTEAVRQQAEPAENGGPMNTYSNNQVIGAIVLGYLFCGYDMAILNNTSANVPSTLIADFLFYDYDSASAGGDKCGFLIFSDYSMIEDNTSTDSSTGFYLDISSSIFNNNVAENNTFFGFSAGMHDYTMFTNNRASYNGGNDWWTGGYDLWLCSCFYGELIGNIAEFNQVGMWVGTESSCVMADPASNGGHLFANNTVRFNRNEGVVFYGTGMMDVVENEFINNEGEGMAVQGGNIGVLTGNTSLYNRDDFCVSCYGGTMPDPFGMNSYGTYLPGGCPLLDWLDGCP